MSLSGSTLSGRYVVGALLSHDAMGDVYLGEDADLSRKVVVKVPHERLHGDADFLGRFAKEVDELSRLSHPGLVAIQGRGEHEGVPFVVVQHLSGGSLADRIQAASDDPLHADDLARWLPDLAKALDFLHVKDVVHQDIRPANILFDEHENPYLADVGLAPLMSASSPTAGIAPGTPSYMAPEQLADAVVTPGVDIYALGTTLYECLSGELPFASGSLMSLAVKKNTTDPRPLREVAPQVSPQVAEVVMRAIARDPDKRFVTSKKLAIWFGRAARGELHAPDAPRAVPAPASTPAPAPEAQPRREQSLPRQEPTRAVVTAAVRVTPPSQPSQRRKPAQVRRTVHAQVSAARRPASPVRKKRSILKWGVLGLIVLGVGLHFLEPELTGAAFSKVKSTLASLLGEGGPDHPQADGFTYLRSETFARGGAAHTVRIYRNEKFATSIGLKPEETALDVEFVLVPQGKFLMGSPESDPFHGDAERPQHEVTVPAFLMARTEMSQRVWKAISAQAGTNPVPGGISTGDLLPLQVVNWADSVKWCRVAGVRLPTEAEWEYACRAGTTTPFSFGASIDPSLVNYNGDFPWPGVPQGMNRGQPVHVGTLPANAFGLHEMHGNVLEWCQDLYDAKGYAGAPTDGSAWEVATSGERVTRGGGCSNAASDARSSARGHSDPDATFSFRAAQFLVPKSSSGARGTGGAKKAPKDLEVASGSALRSGQVLPLGAQLSSPNGKLALRGEPRDFMLRLQNSNGTSSFYPAFPAVLPDEAKNAPLFLKLGDEEDGQTGFYVFFLDPAGQRQIVWSSPDGYPRGVELRVQDTGRVEFIGADGLVKGFFEASASGWKQGWRTGAAPGAAGPSRDGPR